MTEMNNESETVRGPRPNCNRRSQNPLGAAIDFYDIDECLAVHSVRQEDNHRFAAIGEAAKSFAHVVVQNTQRRGEVDIAIKSIQAAAMWAREAILLENRATPSRVRQQVI
jgi:hypothetical protein